MVWGKNKKKSEGIVWRLLWMICLVFVILLLIANVSPLIAPDKIWIPAFMGLGYPALLLIVLIFSILLALNNVKKAIIPALAILSGIGLLNHSYSFRNHTNNFPAEETDISIMSWNVHLFDLYSWKDPGRIKDSIIDYIEYQSPDVLCLQEFYKDKGSNFDTENEIISACNYKYRHIDYFLIKRGIHHFGMTIFSKYPIIQSGSIKMNNSTANGNYVIWSDLFVNEDTVRIYNVHLQSIKFSVDDQDLFVSQTSLTQNDIKSKSGNLLRKLKSAFIARAKQVRFVRNKLNDCPYPYFICGDFNDTPTSYAYRIMRGNLNDAFLDAGPRGFGKTYNGIYPSFRIDYILYPDEFEASHFTIGNKEFSDHFPIYCNFKQQKKD